MTSGMGWRGGASRLDKSHHCSSLQREGQERAGEGSVGAIEI